MSSVDALYATYKLVSSTRQIADTGEVLDSYGKQPSGYLSYFKNGRMMVLIERSDRDKPASVAWLTGLLREALFSSMTNYGGTFRLDGKTIEHHIDISCNEVWTGTVQVRYVKITGNTLTLVTRPAPAAADGMVSVSTLVWQ